MGPFLGRLPAAAGRNKRGRIEWARAKATPAARGPTVRHAAGAPRRALPAPAPRPPPRRAAPAPGPARPRAGGADRTRSGNPRPRRSRRLGRSGRQPGRRSQALPPPQVSVGVRGGAGVLEGGEAARGRGRRRAVAAASRSEGTGPDRSRLRVSDALRCPGTERAGRAVEGMGCTRDAPQGAAAAHRDTPGVRPTLPGQTPSRGSWSGSERTGDLRVPGEGAQAFGRRSRGTLGPKHGLRCLSVPPPRSLVLGL